MKKRTGHVCTIGWIRTCASTSSHFATHLFEGRWLQEVEASNLLKPDYKLSQGRAAQEAKWRRYAMLTPCLVTTMYTGPGFFNFYTGETRALFNFIDLLIVDEAGAGRASSVGRHDGADEKSASRRRP